MVLDEPDTLGATTDGPVEIDGLADSVVGGSTVGLVIEAPAVGAGVATGRRHLARGAADPTDLGQQRRPLDRDDRQDAGQEGRAQQRPQPAGQGPPKGRIRPGHVSPPLCARSPPSVAWAGPLPTCHSRGFVNPAHA